jgi:hypothetical protein
VTFDSPMLKFEPARLIFYQDLERNPHNMFSEEANQWNKKDDRRLLLIALERYLMIFDYLHKTNQYLRP